jgi:hypothetical protein
MIEIIVVVWAIRRFIALAKEKGYSRWLWGILGGLSFYLPIILFFIFVSPILEENQVFHTNSQIQDRLFLSFINIMIGTVTCLITYFVLKRIPNKFEFNEQLLDDFDRP